MHTNNILAFCIYMYWPFCIKATLIDYLVMLHEFVNGVKHKVFVRVVFDVSQPLIGLGVNATVNHFVVATVGVVNNDLLIKGATHLIN